MGKNKGLWRRREGIKKGENKKKERKYGESKQSERGKKERRELKLRPFRQLKWKGCK